MLSEIWRISKVIAAFPCILSTKHSPHVNVRLSINNSSCWSWLEWTFGIIAQLSTNQDWTGRGHVVFAQPIKRPLFYLSQERETRNTRISGHISTYCECRGHTCTPGHATPTYIRCYFDKCNEYCCLLLKQSSWIMERLWSTLRFLSSTVGASDLPGDKDRRHTCAALGGNTRHSSIPQSFPVITFTDRSCKHPSFTAEVWWYSPGNKWIRSSVRSLR